MLSFDFSPWVTLSGNAKRKQRKDSPFALIVRAHHEGEVFDCDQ